MERVAMPVSSHMSSFPGKYRHRMGKSGATAVISGKKRIRPLSREIVKRQTCQNRRQPCGEQTDLSHGVEDFRLLRGKGQEKSGKGYE